MASNHRCDEYNQLLSAYLDGEVTAAERTELLQHLATCASCRATMEQYRSIGTRIRGLPPVLCPDSLTGAIYAQTVDAPPRRLSVLSSRASYPIAAIAAVLLVFVVAAFLLVDGYQRRIDPSVVGASVPDGGTASIYDPIRISFNKEMDRESVENALIIKPTSDLQRLDLKWEGNTLIIGGNELLKPSTQYEISFSSQAHDKWGNPLSEPYELGFGTSTTIPKYDTAEIPTSTSTPTVTPEQQASSNPSPAAAPPTTTPESDNQALTIPTPAFTPVAPSQDGAGTGGEGITDPTPGGDTAARPTQPPPPPTATPDPTETPLPTATPEPDPVETEEPTPAPPTPTKTPVPEPTATLEPEPTAVPVTPTTEPEPEPTQTQTPEPGPVGVEGSFGNVYWSNDLVQERLGEPLAPALDGVNARELDFQQGKMFLQGASGTIYIMYTNGRWESIPDTSAEPLPEFSEGAQEGLWIPGGMLGHHWKANPDLQERLGQALEDQEHVFTTIYQEFVGGYMLSSSDGFIYVIYLDNSSWELYPDAGPLSNGEPTPAPSG